MTRHGLTDRAARLARGLRRRVYDRRDYLLLRAPALAAAPPTPTGVTLVRVTAAQPGGRALAATAMRQADEPPEVDARLAHGDEFFGWVEGGEVQSFGWVCFRDRTVAAYRYPEVAGQAFLYNFVTAPRARGRGLYPALLSTMRHTLGAAGYDRFEIDVRIDNTASVRGIRKAGFVEVGRVGTTTWLGRFRRHAAPRWSQR